MNESTPKKQYAPSAGVIVIKTVAAVLFTLITLAGIAYFIYLVAGDIAHWKKYIGFMFIGWAVSYVCQMLYDTLCRRTLIKIFRGMGIMAKWEAGNLFMQLVMWLLIYVYGTLFAIAVSFVTAPVSAFASINYQR